MIRFEHVTKEFGDRRVLDDVTYEIEKGEIFTIVGPSGTGKSVSLKHMIRLLSPTSGRVWVGDDCVSEAEGRELSRIRSRFGYLFQSAALLVWMDVYDNVALPLREKTRLTEGEIEFKVVTRSRRSASAARAPRCPPTSPAACRSAPASPARS